MALDRLEHVTIRTEDVEATRAFYEDLGLRAGDRPPFSFHGYWLYLGATPCIHLTAAAPEAQGTGSIDHIAFTATDHAGVVARLEAAGARIRERTVPMLGLRQVFVDDPNGVTVELNFPAEPAAP